MALALFGFSAALYCAVAVLAGGPGTADAAFYASAADAIAHGRLTVNFLWSFNEVGAVIPTHPQLPVPIGGHWLPGTALVAAPVVWLLGPAWPVPALATALVAALAAPVAWWLALDLGLDRRLALVAAVMVALAGPMLPFLGQSDNHGLAVGLGSLCLLLAGRAALGSERALIGAAFAAGVMMLTRNDALLYLLPLLAAAWLGRRHLSGKAIAATVLVIGALVTPWWLHQLITFGTLSPSAAGGRSLWILDLHEFDQLGPLNIGDMLSRGAPALIASRLNGLWTVFVLHALFLGVGGLLLPFSVYEAFRRRKQAVLVPALLFGAGLFALAVLVFPAHVGNGMYIRSGAAILPASLVLGLAGVERFAANLGRRPWGVALRVSLIAIGAAQAILALAVTLQFVGHWNESQRQWQWIRQQLSSVASAGDRLGAYDAASAYWYTGYPSVVMPDESAETLLAVARAYELDWLVVQRDQTVPALASLLDGDRPAWVAAPVAQIVGADGRLEVAIYPINRSP